LFIGFETLDHQNLKLQNKHQNLDHNYTKAIQRLHELGVMINGSFVFGMDNDDLSVFDRTVEWAVQQGIETATFHILTPYPGTVLYERMKKDDRILTSNWDLYDTRHTVFSPAHMSPETLEKGYWRSYREFYKWSNIFRAGSAQRHPLKTFRHIAYAGGWKKFEPLWGWVIRAKRVTNFLPLLETVLSGFGSVSS